MDKTCYNPVAVAYQILVKALHEDPDRTVEGYEIAIEQAIGFLGEALDG